MAEELVAAAHGEHAGAGRDRALEGRLLVFEEVFVHERLLAILAAAEEKDIDLIHAFGRAPPELDEPCLEVAPLGALEQGEDVAAIAVDVHEVGIQPADRERLLVPCHLFPLCLPVRLGPTTPHQLGAKVEHGGVGAEHVGCLAFRCRFDEGVDCARGIGFRRLRLHACVLEPHGEIIGPVAGGHDDA